MEIQEEIRVIRFIEYDGFRFYPDKKGYWLGHVDGNRKRLHIYVWEKYNGAIPKDSHIHHIDHNTDNNDIENLELMNRYKHMKLHADLRDKEALRQNLTENARPKASIWHGSEQGLEWHKEHYEGMKDKWYKRVDIKCINCGKDVNMGVSSHVTKYCSDSCKDKYKAMMGTYDEERICATCGNKFMANKYGKATTCSKSCAGKLRWKKKKE